jgi:hypothetical protein
MNREDIEWAIEHDYDYAVANLTTGLSQYCQFDELCQETKKELIMLADVYYWEHPTLAKILDSQ